MPRRKLTYREYLHFPADGRRHEIVDGEHHVQSVPVPYHQTVSRLLKFQLMEQVELPGRGLVFNAPIDLQLSESDVVQPDLVVVLRANRGIVTPTKIKGVPDLVVEVVSPSTERHDRQLKKGLYERSAVPEYWIVDTGERSVEQWLLEGERYELAGTEQEALTFRGLAAVRVDLTRVWTSPTPED